MILTIGPGGCGFTFLNWTISYLRGDIFYTNLKGQQTPVDIDPLDGDTAHNFKKDHLKIENSKDILAQGTDLSIVYLVPGSQQDFLNLVKLPGKKIIFDNSVNPKELLARSCLTIPCCEESIVVCLDHLSERYGEAAVRWMFLECASYFVQYYQLPSKSENNYYPINYFDLFQHLDCKLPGLFEFLERSIDQDRLQNWKRIYRSYRSKNSSFIERFLGSESAVINADLKKTIFKDILCWRNGHRHLIKSN